MTMLRRYPPDDEPKDYGVGYRLPDVRRCAGCAAGLPVGAPRRGRRRGAEGRDGLLWCPSCRRTHPIARALAPEPSDRQLHAWSRNHGWRVFRGGVAILSGVRFRDPVNQRFLQLALDALTAVSWTRERAAQVADDERGRP